MPKPLTVDPTVHTASELADAITLLQQLIEPCEGTTEYSWRKCRRCAAVHGIENRFGLSMRLLQTALDALTAAPELLAALKAILVAYDGTDDVLGPSMKRKVQTARAVVAKTEAHQR
jgi:hypothetical protein